MITFNTTVHVSVYDLETMIKEYILLKQGVTVDNIKFDIVSEICGIDQTPCANLKGVTLQGSKTNE